LASFEQQSWRAQREQDEASAVGRALPGTPALSMGCRANPAGAPLQDPSLLNAWGLGSSMLSLLKAVTGESDEKEKDTMVRLDIAVARCAVHRRRERERVGGWESRI
jgi:hypothetical protein